jgi:hypothetical protein
MARPTTVARHPSASCLRADCAKNRIGLSKSSKVTMESAASLRAGQSRMTQPEAEPRHSAVRQRNRSDGRGNDFRSVERLDATARRFQSRRDGARRSRSWARRSANQVAADLNRRKVPAPAGGHWFATHVLRLRQRLEHAGCRSIRQSATSREHPL